MCDISAEFTICNINKTFTLYSHRVRSWRHMEIRVEISFTSPAAEGLIRSVSSSDGDSICIHHTIELICYKSCSKNSIKLNQSRPPTTGVELGTWSTVNRDRMPRMGWTGIYDLVRRFICYCWWFILNRNQIEGQTCPKESLVQTSVRSPGGSRAAFQSHSGTQSWTCDLLCAWSGSCEKKQTRGGRNVFKLLLTWQLITWTHKNPCPEGLSPAGLNDHASGQGCG